MALVDSAAAWLDTAVVRTRRLRGAPDARVDAMEAEERLVRLRALVPVYGADALLDYGSGLLVPGPQARPTLTAARRGVDLAWPSAFTPFNPDVGAAFLDGSPPNATVHARLFRAGPRPGPVVVAIHGYGAGHVQLEQLVWPIRAWNQRGIDVVLPVLPFHGRRADPGRLTAPRFPASDPRLTHEGFRQAVHDLTGLLGWLRAEGHGPIGLAGMSLGGYTAALLATLERDLACAVLVIPLASIADFARAHGRLGTGGEAESLHAALEAVYRPSSPLARPPLVPADRVWIAAARGDRVTGVAHAERLGAHFGVRPRVGSGGHLLQVGLEWPAIVAFTAERLR